MSPRHFSKLSKVDNEIFNKDVDTITGMLYTIAKWPIKPFLPAFYKTATEYKKDYEPMYNLPNQDCPCGCPPNNCTCCCSNPNGCAHRK